MAEALFDDRGRRLDQIQLVGLEAHGFHGVYAEERQEGQAFVADVVLHVDARIAAARDDIEETIHYGELAERVIQVITGESVDLIETLATRVAGTALSYPGVVAVDVEIHKPQAPLVVPFRDVVVSIRRFVGEVADPLAVPEPAIPLATSGEIEPKSRRSVERRRQQADLGEAPGGHIADPHEKIAEMPSALQHQDAGLLESEHPRESSDEEAFPDDSFLVPAPGVSERVLPTPDLETHSDGEITTMPRRSSRKDPLLVSQDMPFPSAVDSLAAPPIPPQPEPSVASTALGEPTPASGLATGMAPDTEFPQSSELDGSLMPPEIAPAFPLERENLAGRPRILPTPATPYANELDDGAISPEEFAETRGEQQEFYPVEEALKDSPDAGAVGPVMTPEAVARTIGGGLASRGDGAGLEMPEETVRVEVPFDPNVGRLDQPPPEPVAVVLALGANLGPTQQTLRQAVFEIDSADGVWVDAIAPLARTSPVGGPEQPLYLNTVVQVTTVLSPRALLEVCQEIENRHGRERQELNGPRTLDIDVVTYHDYVESGEGLELPHPRAFERAFVLIPWSEMDPNAVLPGFGGGLVAELAAYAPDREGVRYMALDWFDESTLTSAIEEAAGHNEPESWGNFETDLALHDVHGSPAEVAESMVDARVEKMPEPVFEEMPWPVEASAMSDEFEPPVEATESAVRNDSMPHWAPELPTPHAFDPVDTQAPTSDAIPQAPQALAGYSATAEADSPQAAPAVAWSTAPNVSSSRESSSSRTPPTRRAAMPEPVSPSTSTPPTGTTRAPVRVEPAGEHIASVFPPVRPAAHHEGTS